MAALYLHNALFRPEPLPDPAHSPRSSRPGKSLSPQSSMHVPLPSSYGPQPSSSSQPSTGAALKHGWGNSYTGECGAQPLLHRLGNADADDAGGATSIGFAEHGYEGGRALKAQRVKRVRLRLRVTKVAMRAGESVFALWTVYTTTRYFTAYTSSSPSTSRDTTNLVLGTLSALAFLPLALQLILSLPIFHLLLLPDLRLVLIAKWCLRSTAVLFLAVPAIVDFSFACTYVARASASCPAHLDISIFWSIGGWQCTAGWVGMGILRLVLTILASALYILPVLGYEQTRHPSFRRGHKFKTSRQEETRLRPMSSRGSSLAPAVGHSRPSSSTLRHSSSGGTMHAANGSPRPSTRTLPSSPLLSPSRRPHPEHVKTGDDNELHAFVDQFRTLVSQLCQEPDEAVNYARRDSAEYNASGPSTSHTLSSWIGTAPLSSPPASYASHSSRSSGSYTISSNPYQDYLDHPSCPHPGYDEFGCLYPPDERVSFLGGYVQRMPTIESLGSREYHSEYTQLLLSRSNTRSTTFGGSHGNSLYLPGEMATQLLAGESMIRELGELAEQLDVARRSESSSPVRTGVDEEGRRRARACASSGSMSGDVGATSCSSLSYYTATTGSRGSAVLYEDAREE